MTRKVHPPTTSLFPSPTSSPSSLLSSSASRFVSTHQTLTKPSFLEFLWFLRAIAVLSVVSNTVFIALFVTVVPFVFLSVKQALLTLLIGAVLYSPTYLGDPAATGRRRWRGFQRGFVMQDIIKWFNGEIVRTKELRGDQQYIFAMAPHGVLPFAASWIPCHKKWEKLFPSISLITLGSSVFHFAPIVRDLAMWCGTRHIDKECFERTLKEGHCPLVIPGGIAELKLSSSESNVIELSGKHQGFIRIALRRGIPIVPVFTFGEIKAFDLLNVPFFSWFFLTYFKIPFPYFLGVGGVLQFPRRVPTTVVVGEPINIPRDLHPTEEKVRELHHRYYHELEKLFEAHKHQYGHREYSLKVLGLK